jgi:hypothetical protein
VHKQQKDASSRGSRGFGPVMAVSVLDRKVTLMFKRVVDSLAVSCVCRVMGIWQVIVTGNKLHIANRQNSVLNCLSVFGRCMLYFGRFPGVCSLNANVSEHPVLHLHTPMKT